MSYTGAGAVGGGLACWAWMHATSGHVRVIHDTSAAAVPDAVPLYPGRHWCMLSSTPAVAVPEDRVPPQTAGRGGLLPLHVATPVSTADLTIASNPAPAQKKSSYSLPVRRPYPPVQDLWTRAPCAPPSVRPTVEVDLKQWLRVNDHIPRTIREIILGLLSRGHLAHSVAQMDAMVEALESTPTEVISIFRQLWSAKIIDWMCGYWVLAPGVTRAALLPSSAEDNDTKEVVLRPPRVRAAPAALPAGWICRPEAGTGRLMYYDISDTGRYAAARACPPGRSLPAGWYEMVVPPAATVVSRTRPAAPRAARPARRARRAAALGWERLLCPAGLPYYKDHVRRATQRHPPPLFNDTRIVPAERGEDCTWDPLWRLWARAPTGSMFVSLVPPASVSATAPRARAPPQPSAVAVVVDPECGIAAAPRLLLPRCSRGGESPNPTHAAQARSLRWIRPRAPAARCGRSTRPRRKKKTTPVVRLRPSVGLWPHQRQACGRWCARTASALRHAGGAVRRQDAAGRGAVRAAAGARAGAVPQQRLRAAVEATIR